MLANLSDIIKLFSRKGRKFYFFISNVAGYYPHSTAHFSKAFTHRSAGAHTNNGKEDPDNERLEFLGDAVIEALVSEALYHRFPAANEGTMSQLRANMVCRARLNEISFSLNLDKYIRLSSRKDLQISHIPGDVLEAFVAAVYLDGGIKHARNFVFRHIANEARIQEALNDTQQTNFKSELVSLGEQNDVEIFFETHRLTEHQLLADGTEANFISEIKLANTLVGQGIGRSKKQAEQAASKEVLQNIQNGTLTLTNNHQKTGTSPSQPSPPHPPRQKRNKITTTPFIQNEHLF